ncbi:MAG: hypothetical protein AAF125_22335, partial [Chloroflexota bacterium]
MTRFFRPGNDPSEDAASLSLAPISLLTPTPAETAPTPSNTAEWETDLGLSDLLEALAFDRTYRRFVRGVLLALPTDPAVIRWRQAVLADLLANPVLTDALAELLPQLASLTEDNAMLGKRSRSLIMETSDRLSELDMYSELLGKLGGVLSSATVDSVALRTLRDEVTRVLALPDYQRLREEIPRLREPLRNIGSLTIGINLDYNLKPTSAVLMAINKRELGEPPSLLDRLFGLDAPDASGNPVRGIAPVHHFPKGDMRKYHDLFQDVDKLMEQTAKPVANALRYYVRTNAHTLKQLEKEIAFFVAATRMIRTSAVSFAQPEVAPVDERVMIADGLHNIALLLRNERKSVASDVRFDNEGRVAVLTGPNSGGKTTFLRNVGLAQVMAQAGLFIPATRASFSPVDRVLTHFPRL